MREQKYDQAEELVNKMMTNYSQYDYNLIMKRARIKQIKMKYEDAIEDANLALFVDPLRFEAYEALYDFCIAENKQEMVFKVLKNLVVMHPTEQKYKN